MVERWTGSKSFVASGCGGASPSDETDCDSVVMTRDLAQHRAWLATCMLFPVGIACLIIILLKYSEN